VRSSTGEAGNSHADADAGERSSNADRDGFDHRTQCISAADAGAAEAERNQQQHRDR